MKMVEQITSEILNKRRTSRPPLDKSQRVCYRCQVKGHYAAECTAAKPVPSSRTSAVQSNEGN